MNKNLSKRIITSIILLAVLSICLFFHNYTWLILLIIASFICFFEFNNLSKKIWTKRKSSIYLSNLIIFFYLTFFIFSAYNFHRKEIIIVLLVCIFSDVGGYIIGKSVGGKKLTKISPNKTISGSIGSFCFALIPIIYFFYYDTIYDYKPNYWELISFVLIFLIGSLYSVLNIGIFIVVS